MKQQLSQRPLTFGPPALPPAPGHKLCRKAQKGVESQWGTRDQARDQTRPRARARCRD